jgi:type I restriction enzyme S subunit
MKWRTARLAELLKPVSRPVAIAPGERYRLLGTQWYAKGLFEREEKDGSEIRAQTLYEVKEGDFVYNRLFAWKGSFAVATATDEGGLVSNEFPSFVADRNFVEPAWLRWYFAQERVWEEALALSAGGTPTSRNRLKEEAFLSMTVPLPPLPEQRRIVARLGQVSSRLLEASELNTQAATALAQLPVLLAHRPDLPLSEKEARGWVERLVGDLVTECRSFHTVDRLATYPNLGIYSFGRGLFEKPPIDGARTSARELNQVRAGQFIYSRLFAFEGAYGVVPTELDGYFVSNEYPTFDCNPNLALPEFLRSYFASPNVWREVAAGSQGLGDRRQRVQPETLLAHRLLVPPLSEQRRILRVAPLAGSATELASACRSESELVSTAVINRFLGEVGVTVVNPGPEADLSSGIGRAK